MANTIISNDAAKAAADAVVDLLDQGSGTAYIKIYDGTQPDGPDEDVSDQNVLAELALNDPAFNDAIDDNPGGKAEAKAITDDSDANASGTASWFRAFYRDGNAVIDGDVSSTDGGGDLQLNTTSISEGAAVEVTDWIITMPES